MADLDQTQRWLQAVIMHPDGIAAGLQTPAAQRELALTPETLETAVTSSTTMTAAERLAIYGRAYHARLTECLRAEFAVLRHALGDELFDLFARAYLSNCPSRSFTLANLGERLPDFLDSTRPGPDPGTDGEDQSWQDFIVDLARLERAFTEVFDGPGVEGKPGLDLDRLRASLVDGQAPLRLAPVVCLRLLVFRSPVHDYFDAVRRDERPDLPAPAETLVAMNRRDYVVRMVELSRSEHELLTWLMQGETLDCSLERAGASSRAPAQRQSLLGSLERWAAQGFFAQDDP